MTKPLLLTLMATAAVCAGQAQYWQQQVDYTIGVSLNDKAHTLDGVEKITYFNNSPDTLSFIWFHLWPNAFKNDKTAFSEQLLVNNRTDFYFSRPEQRGYINRLDFKVNGVTAKTEDHPQYIDIVKLMLPAPLPPGQHIAIATPFHVQLPENFSRGGHMGQSYQLTQWYPKPAVYDSRGWHPIPYLDQGEFYSEFGNYDVRITLPANYAVAATGELQNPEEKEWLKKRAGFSWKPIITKLPADKHRPGYVKKIVQEFPPSSASLKTLQFKQERVHDFALFADKRFVVRSDTLRLPSGRIIEVAAYYLPADSVPWKNSLGYIKNAIRFRSSVIGEYPYSMVSVVEAKMGFSGGMEYPTIAAISLSGPEINDLESIIEHEVGHNWLYGILASNERRYPWMDEGMNTYYDNRYASWKKAQPPRQPGGIDETRSNPALQKFPEDFERVLLASMIAIHRDQPINTPSEEFTQSNYSLVAYTKTSEWMKKLEARLGKTLFDSCMQEYYRRWQFRHPYPEDFRTVIESVSGGKQDSVFALLNETGPLQPPVKKKLRVTGLFNFRNTDTYSYVNIMPVPGYNEYDGFMAGALVHNYGLPVNRFRFLLAPLYATRSKQFNYLARVSYDWFPGGSVRKIETGIAAAKFSTDEYQPPGKDRIVLGFRKYVPFLRFSFSNRDPLSKLQRYVQLKTYFISEDAADFRTTINGRDTMNTVNKVTGNRYLNELQLVVSNPRILYPYEGSVRIEQAKDFTRASFTGSYYFNYANREGGLRVRLFAGKFLYNGAATSSKQFATDRYQLNMTGANGYEDYTYSDYFLGRNKFEGLASQQIMMRDGFFKVRTDLLSSKVGKTDNWLTAANFSSDIPKNINPLSLLPVKIPLKVFADVGTYAQAWQNDAPGSRFLYDAGIQLSLLKETVNIYFPLLYSKVYRDYFNSVLGNGHFWKTVSFNISLRSINLRKLDSHLDL